MLANLFGDFVKGSKFNHFSVKIQEGIILHRKIDSFIDQHKDVLELKILLYRLCSTTAIDSLQSIVMARSQ
jgi:acyl carrier protein phosphodiesterase